MVEGADARLAVECDGDAWHGSDRYEQDMARQRQLERAGWTFVRIRESAWYADREAAVKSVVDACEDLGIRPVEILEDGSPSLDSVADMDKSNDTEDYSHIVDPGSHDATASGSALSPETVELLAVATSKTVAYWALKGYRAVGQMIAQIRDEHGEQRWSLMRPYFAETYEDVRESFQDKPWVTEMTPEQAVEAEMAAAEDAIELLETAPASEVSAHRESRRAGKTDEPELDTETNQAAEILHEQHVLKLDEPEGNEQEMRPPAEPTEKNIPRLEASQPLETKAAAQDERDNGGRLRLHETEALDWVDVKGFFQEYGSVVVGSPELRWYEESWGALMNSGLADANHLEEFEHPQVTLKLRVICLLAMYLGIYQETGEFSPLGGYFSGHHPFSWYLDTLKVEKEDLWEMAHKEGFIGTDSPNYWEDEDTSDEDLESFAMTLVESENPSICHSLREHYGGDVGLFVSIWNSRLPLESLDDPWSSAYRDADKLNPSQFVESAYGGDGELEIWEYVRRGMSSWTLLDS